MDVQISSPKSKGINALQIWMFGCVVSVFMALLVYGFILIKRQRGALINQTDKNTKTLNDETHECCMKQCKEINMVTNEEGENCTTSTTQRTTPYHKTCRKKNRNRLEYHDITEEVQQNSFEIKKLDTICLAIFPTSFFIFVAAYLFIFQQGS